jgi:glyoxylase-like metal-dependent hydrolase (beta-lactamase superfamily II)
VPPPEVTRIRDTCNVWAIRSGRDAVCIDIGSGAFLDDLDAHGIDRVTDVLLTHHHRDNAAGAARAAAAGARIWVPPVERELFTHVDEFWTRRQVANQYRLGQDSQALLEPVEIAGTVDEYRTRSYGGIGIFTLPTPGHTVGSVTYLAELGGRLHAFSGDLLAGAGKLWSVAATQWSYTGVDGQGATILSCGLLARRGPDVVLPAHGEPIEDPASALAETQRLVGELMELRRVEEEPWNLERWLDEPWRELSPHLLQNRTSIATSYALLSESGAALLVDWGYDLWTGWELGVERHQARPRLESALALRRDHGVERVEAIVTTHFHDDHVAGANLLRDVEGTEVWSPANVAPILEHPERYDLPCLWFDPIPVDRVLPLGEPVHWHEYELVVHPLPGHTRFAAAIELEVDGRRVLATGDQQTNQTGGRPILNYQYRNRFALGDYVASAALYARLRPDLVLTGHWGTHELPQSTLDALAEDAVRVDELHRELLVVPDAEGSYARVTPYRSTVAAGAVAELRVEVRNPFAGTVPATVRLALPDGWEAEPAGVELELDSYAEVVAAFRVRTAGPPRRVAVAAELVLDGIGLGQHAEALVTVT